MTNTKQVNREAQCQILRKDYLESQANFEALSQSQNASKTLLAQQEKLLIRKANYYKKYCE